jgi:hypothetical protein
MAEYTEEREVVVCLQEKMESRFIPVNIAPIYKAYRGAMSYSLLTNWTKSIGLGDKSH